MMREKPRNMPVLPYSEDYNGKCSTKGAKLLLIRATSVVLFGRIGNERMELFLRDSLLFDQRIEEEAFKTSVVTLLVGQRHEPLIDHKKLNPSEEFLGLMCRLLLQRPKEPDHTSTTAETYDQRGVRAF
jgi:hypothetical protein